MLARYSIKDLERLTGIKAHTLRIWEQRYHILRPERTDTNIRFYNDADVKKILNISLLNRNGYKISKIAGLTDEEILAESQKILANYQSETDQMENLKLAVIELDDLRFEEAMNLSVKHFGTENTFEKIIFPFLKQLGNMWQVGMITPAQEHFISNLIRQKIISAIDRLPLIPSKTEKNFLFFLPNDELHEIGLLYCYYLTKKSGYKSCYLGQSVPFEDLVNIYNSVRPDYMVTIFTGQLKGMDVASYLTLLHKEMPQVKFLISGRVFFEKETASPESIPAGFTFFNDFSSFKEILNS